jgi:hypothetical protein
MEDTDKADKRTPLPDEFTSEDEAGAFWDTHSMAEYEEFLEPVEFRASNLRRSHDKRT